MYLQTNQINVLDSHFSRYDWLSAPWYQNNFSITYNFDFRLNSSISCLRSCVNVCITTAPATFVISNQWKLSLLFCCVMQFYCTHHWIVEHTSQDYQTYITRFRIYITRFRIYITRLSNIHHKISNIHHKISNIHHKIIEYTSQV